MNKQQLASKIWESANRVRSKLRQTSTRIIFDVLLKICTALNCDILDIMETRINMSGSRELAKDAE